MLLVAFSDQVEALFGPMGYTNLAFILLVYSPGLVGVFMVWRHYGRPGLASFFGRLTLWRMSGGWWALLLLGMPAVFYAGAAVTGTVEDFPFDPWFGVLPALAAAFLIGPIEELSAFLMSGTKQASWAYGPFFLGVVAISVILTPMFNAARGSLLVAPAPAGRAAPDRP